MKWRLELLGALRTMGETTPFMVATVTWARWRFLLLICSFACKLFSLSSKLIASRLPLHFYLRLASQVQSPSCHCFFVYWYIWMLMTLTVKMHWKTSDQHTHSSSISRTDLATISSTWRTNLRDSSGNGAGRLFLHWRSWLYCVWVSKACRRAPHSTTSGTKKR